MDGQPTRAVRGDDSILVRTQGEWRRFGEFLRRPVLPPRAELSLAGTARALPPLLGLDLALMAIVLGAIGAAAGLGLKMPEHLLSGLEMSGWLVAALVLGAPIAEEIIFRGWVSGRPGHVLAVAAILLGGAGLLVVGGGLASAAAAGGGLLVAAVALFALRKRDAMGWFARHFGWFFYLSALLFAAVHLSNFAAAGLQSAMLLPLVLPQFLLGLLLAYLRIHRGLWSSMLLHACHNSLFVGLMVASAS